MDFPLHILISVTNQLFYIKLFLQQLASQWEYSGLTPSLAPGRERAAVAGSSCKVGTIQWGRFEHAAHLGRQRDWCPPGCGSQLGSTTCTPRLLTEQERDYGRWAGYKRGGQGVRLWQDGWDSCAVERPAYYELVSKPSQVSVQMHSPVATGPPSCSANMLCPSFIWWWVICCLDKASNWRGDLHFSSQRFWGSFNVGLNSAAFPNYVKSKHKPHTLVVFQVRINFFFLFHIGTTSGFDRRVC